MVTEKDNSATRIDGMKLSLAQVIFFAASTINVSKEEMNQIKLQLPKRKVASVPPPIINTHYL